MKVKILIAILLGSLILVNIGHNIIPHHHHLDYMYSHAGCEQHDANDHPEDHACETEDPSHHCHAFNGFEFVISYEKQLDKVVVTKTSSIYSLTFIPENEPLPREKISYFSGGPPPDMPGFLGESSGLRAPPTNS